MENWVGRLVIDLNMRNHQMHKKMHKKPRCPGDLVTARPKLGFLTHYVWRTSSTDHHYDNHGDAIFVISAKDLAIVLGIVVEKKRDIALIFFEGKIGWILTEKLQRV